MNHRFTSDRVRVFWETLMIGLFLALLWLPTLDHFFKLDHARSPMENRRLAAWPQVRGIGQSRDFIMGIENYFSDHFGFRKRLIRWNNHWKGQLFRNDSDRDVLIGRDGWLFFSGDEMFEHWTRQRAWSAQDLENWRRLLEMRRDWLRERGGKYILVVPPDKQTVYPEYLPQWLESSARPSKVQQLSEYMKAHSTVEVLDLSRTLIEAKKIRVNYLKTDTHWNLFGGFMGYRALVEALARQLPGLEPLAPDSYEWKPAERAPGDLTVLLGTTDSYPETQAVEPIAEASWPELKMMEDAGRFPRRNEKEQKTRYTLNDNASGKAIVFRDSFAGSWPQFLGRHFRQVIYVWHYDWDRSLVEREKPDVVIDEMVERFFNVTDPVELASLDRESEKAPRPSP